MGWLVGDTVPLVAAGLLVVGWLVGDTVPLVAAGLLVVGWLVGDAALLSGPPTGEPEPQPTIAPATALPSSNTWRTTGPAHFRWPATVTAEVAGVGDRALRADQHRSATRAWNSRAREGVVVSA